MNKPFFYAVSLFLILGLCLPAYALDMRSVYQRALSDLSAAKKEKEDAGKRILGDEAALTERITAIKGEIEKRSHSLAHMKEELGKEEKKHAKLTPEKDRVEKDMSELPETGREAARDLIAILRQSCLNARYPQHAASLEPIAAKDHFPGMDDLQIISDLYLLTSELSGEVTFGDGCFIDPSGRECSGEILTIGPFSAAYRKGSEVGLLDYDQTSGHLRSLPSGTPWLMRLNLDRYMKGKTDTVFVDLSSGAGLRQIIERPTLKQRMEKGGLLVWPIIVLGLAALCLGAERVMILRRIHENTDKLMGRINEFADRNDWHSCEKLLSQARRGPVRNILVKGIANREESRETLESVLQESILRELPSLEKFLPTINIVGAICPLLGLLGTVSGMICTFHAITLYGTGDPKIMSGGISEALITTQLGLAMAIPIMLVHTFLSSRVDHIISDMEEKAVALTNAIFKSGVNGA